MVGKPCENMLSCRLLTVPALASLTLNLDFRRSQQVAVLESS
jgi:hypothetical protein